jgi:hypothetical protein
MAGAMSAAEAQQGTLDTIRQDVRQGPPPGPAHPSDDRSCPATSSNGNSDPDSSSSLSDFFGALLCSPLAAGVAVTSPIWGPHSLLGDDFSIPGHFPQYPYDDPLPGYIVKNDGNPNVRDWACRFEARAMETFDHLESVGGHLLVSTTWRVGVEASFDQLQERLLGGRYDALWLGDCNLVYRFAEASWAEFRAGLGANVLYDRGGNLIDDPFAQPGRTDLGFNFIYAADFFPAKPWVISASLDAGTLGQAGLFRSRITAGAVWHGLEAFTGYEYTDIGRAHWNGLILGLGVWF